MSEERWSFTLEKLVNIFRSSKTSTPLPYPKPLEKFIKDTGMNLEVDIDPLMLKLMEDVAKGLNHFHKMGFFHRDLNPQNVVIVCGNKSMTTKIANFCTAERIGIKPKAPISNYGTGFQPREQIKNNNLRKLNGVVKTPETSSVDFFSFGCLLFYSLTLGEHPFGAPYGTKPEVIDSLICRSNLVLHHCRTPEAETLVSRLMKHTPHVRISITSALNFPLFWCFEKRLAYLKNVSEMMEQWGQSGQLIEAYLDFHSIEILGPALDWSTKIDPPIITYINDPNNPNLPSFYSSVRRLVRLIRNQHSHYAELPANIKVLYKGEVQGIEEYYRKIFPRLLIRAYEAVDLNIAKVNAEFGKYMINYHA
ncbi:unnamed protein product [Arabidopsis lyrata]|uniref:Protein kinase domain-containing protein n=1 Tax=Arabidopsis lyrata subsp. lyrata TaxID=81972 RepID=D7MWI4_ARALL|nr:inactive serine/threonine-protein kinase/endoribonuclease IRE1-like [Arabidopsis lyrata subsp. lyrata]EFH39104.1 hypothetical protein ARALYDRAFT_920219 [Arabidopsis lyrata subsp. lyrata]CAH8261194.1 unnamed protein product [Arabidopsis lyrata]|eukprot:XP_002862846.1 inactive serine/threonine-protein kinase/endoribonuclease IRE1-like [Arabidopsis lyrata subsp. lyrata]